MTQLFTGMIIVSLPSRLWPSLATPMEPALSRRLPLKLSTQKILNAQIAASALALGVFLLAANAGTIKLWSVIRAITYYVRI